MAKYKQSGYRPEVCRQRKRSRKVLGMMKHIFEKSMENA